jgi:hypothetical protein
VNGHVKGQRVRAGLRADQLHHLIAGCPVRRIDLRDLGTVRSVESCDESDGRLTNMNSAVLAGLDLDGVAVRGAAAHRALKGRRTRSEMDGFDARRCFGVGEGIYKCPRQNQQGREPNERTNGSASLHQKHGA